MTHTHKCSDCGTPVECWGELQRNPDGFPDTICTAIHWPAGWVEQVCCESCGEAREHEQDSEVGA